MFEAGGAMRSVLDQAPHYHVHQQKPFHLNTAASIVIVFCGLGASISFMAAVALYFCCFKNRTRSAADAESRGGDFASAAAAENRATREKMSKRLVERLPVAALREVCERSSAECCSVCLNEFREVQEDHGEEKGLQIRQLPDCGHVFHTECIQLWLASYLSCPLCRANLVVEENQTVHNRQYHHQPATAASPAEATAAETSGESQHLVIEASDYGGAAAAAEGTSENPFKVNGS